VEILWAEPGDRHRLRRRRGRRAWGRVHTWEDGAAASDHHGSTHTLPTPTCAAFIKRRGFAEQEHYFDTGGRSETRCGSCRRWSVA
jgi:hypothetical protein